MLQFEEPIGVVEGLERSSELGGYNRREHDSILPDGDSEMIQIEPEDLERIRVQSEEELRHAQSLVPNSVRRSAGGMAPPTPEGGKETEVVKNWRRRACKEKPN
jgi:hypothetical protein